MPNIDDLSIGIKSNVTSATNSIDKLITKLGALSASLGQVNTDSFSAMASGIRQISSATNSMNNSGAKNLTELSLALRKFGSKTANQATTNIPQLSNAIMQLAGSVSTVGSSSFNTDGITNLASAINKLGGAKSTTAVENIPQLTLALQNMTVGLNQLGSSSSGISSLGQLASSLSKLGGKTVTNAITNVPKLTTALMQMMNTLARAPQVSQNTIQLVNALANLASQGSKVGTASHSLYNGFLRFGKGADIASKKSFSLASAIGKLYASYWLLLRAFRGVGSGIELASDLTEVQNVVDVTFGKYRNLIEEFADTSIQEYGMSELTAKQIASRYQAMGGAIGFAQGQMADMSIELTKLAADMASFYNVEQDVVAEDLESIFTGQTRPLRAYGLDLTEATLQEWALSQGMEANMSTMTQAEKVLLRYSYVLEQTGMAQGDFARTQGTWANQIRILKQQFQELSAVIGQNFIYALKPLVSALNTAMAKVIQFANVVSASLGKIFGWKFEDTTGGITQDLEFGAEYAEDLSSGLGGAADKAKKLKQQLQGFDELNVLTTNKDTTGGGGGGSLGDAIANGNIGQWVKDSEDKFFESDLDSLYKLGEYISTTLTNTLNDIDWDSVYQGAKDFGFGLSDFLNGLISPDLFGATGKTIAGALNTAIYSSLAFGENFDFDEFGSSIAQGVNDFFDEFDFEALGKNVKAWVLGLKESLLVAVAEIEWQDVLEGIGDLFKGLGSEAIATLFGFKVLGVLFKNGLFGTLGSVLRTTTTLPTGLATGITTTAGLIASSFKSAIIGAFAGWNIAKYLIFTYDDEISDFFENLGFDMYKNFDEAYAAEAKRKAHERELIGLTGMEASDNNIVYYAQVEYGKQIQTDKLAEQIGGDLVKKANKATKVLNAFGISTEDLADVTKTAFKRIAKEGEVFSVLADTLPKYSSVMKEGVTEQFNSTRDNISNVFDYITGTVFGDKYSQGTEKLKEKTRLLAEQSSKHYQTISDSATASLNKVNITTSDTTSDIVEKYKTMYSDTKSSVLGMSTSVLESFTGLKTSTGSTLSALNTETKLNVGILKKTVTDGMGDTVTGANDKLSSLVSVVGKQMNNATAKVGATNWYTSGQNLVEGLKSGVSNKWNVGSASLTAKIVSLASNLTTTLKNAFGIHSPSRLWEEEIGFYLTKGLEVGILGEEGHLANSIVGMGSRLTNTMSGALTLATPSSLGGNYDFGVTSTMAHQYSADGSMVGNIAQGVRDGVYSAQAEQNALLREQNNLLLQILNKEGISMDDVYSGVVNRNRDNINRTGLNPLMAY